jgi:hypothetical protein
MEGSALSETKEETMHKLRARDVGGLATLDSLSTLTERRIFIVCILLCIHDVEKKVYGSTPGPTGTICRNSLGQAALRREQQDQFENNHHENRATGEKGETDHRRHKHGPWTRRNGGTPVGYSGQIALRRKQCGIQTSY